MAESVLKAIAHIETDFPEKFGIPRQSGLVPEAGGMVIFEPEYRDPEALKGLDSYDYLWLLWKFEVPEGNGWHATVKPPRLGGNTHVGVFATRSPFRPNHIGLSSVKIERICLRTPRGPIIQVSGVDLRDGTPIYDVKPYLPYVDSHPGARGGFAEERKGYRLKVEFPQDLLNMFPEEKQRAIVKVLEQDPRPSYQNDPERKYGVSFAGYDVHFYVSGDLLCVFEVVAQRPKIRMENTQHAGK